MTKSQVSRISELVARPALAASEVTKTFGAVRALKEVTVSLFEGEVLAIVGENGAGKSTLIGCFTGSVSPDSGTLRVGETDHAAFSPRGALESRIAVIHQEPVLVPTLSVAENIFLGGRASKQFLFSRSKVTEHAKRCLKAVNSAISPWALVGDLPPADRQMVEIAKAAGSGVKVLFLDEPTAALTPTETNRLFTLIRSMKAQGVAVGYVSHRLEEILEISDRVLVMRDGRVVDSGATSEFGEARLVQSMTGRDGPTVSPTSNSDINSAPLRLRATGLNQGPLRSASLDVRAGEIVGVAGIVGSSRSRLLSTLAGIARPDAGSMEIDGVAYAPRSPRAAINKGVAFVSEDRHRSGLFTLLSQAENLVFSSIVRASGLTSARNQARRASPLLERLAVRPPDPRVLAGTLSGGNQQKLLIGRALMLDPQILLIDEPTRGVDVGAKHEIHELLREIAGRGTSIVVVSSDLRELMGLCNRIVVMSRGTTVAQFSAPFDAVKIMHSAVSESSATQVEKEQ